MSDTSCIARPGECAAERPGEPDHQCMKEAGHFGPHHCICGPWPVTHVTATTPTGIPIIDCDICGQRHPVSRSHCPRCGLAHLFDCQPAPTVPPEGDYDTDLFGVPAS